MKHKSMKIGGFIILNILTGICGGVIAIVLPLYAQSIGASIAQVGLIRGVSGIGMLIMVLPSGILIDRFGEGKLYGIGCVLETFTSIALALMGSPLLLIGLMFIKGFSNSLRFTSLNAAFFSNLKEIGVNKSGWYRGSMSIGLTFLGPVIGGFLVQYFDYPLIFSIIAVLSFIPILFIGRLTTQKAIKLAPVNPEEARKFSFVDEGKEFLVLFKNRTLRNSVILEGISTACFSTFAAFIVIFVVNIIGLDKQKSSYFLLIEGSAYIVSVFSLGGLLLKFNKPILYLGSTVTMSLGLLLMGVTSSSVPILIGVTLLGLGTGLLNILTFSNLGTVDVPKGKLSSVLSVCTSTGASFGPMFGGIIGEIVGYHGIFLSYIPILLGVMFLTQFIRTTKTTKEAEAAL